MIFGECHHNKKMKNKYKFFFIFFHSIVALQTEYLTSGCLCRARQNKDAKLDAKESKTGRAGAMVKRWVLFQHGAHEVLVACRFNCIIQV